MKNKRNITCCPAVVKNIKYIENNYDIGIIIDKSNKNLWIKIFDKYMFNTYVIDKNSQLPQNESIKNIKITDNSNKNDLYRVVVLNEHVIDTTFKTNHLWIVLTEPQYYDCIDLTKKNIIILNDPRKDICLYMHNNYYSKYSDDVMLKSVENVGDIKNSDNMCAICFDVSKNMVKTNCDHIYCYDCITQNLKNNNKCPLCRTDIDADNFIYNTPLDLNKYTYIDSIICDCLTYKLLFCSLHSNIYFKHFSKKYPNVVNINKWSKQESGCSFVDPLNIGHDIMTSVDKIILLDENIDDKIFDFMKIYKNVHWHLNICS